MLKLDRASKTYRKGAAAVTAADDLSLELQHGDFAVIQGPSGSGKSTLLLMAGGMLPPDSGSVLFEGEDVYRWSSARRNRYRKRTVGFIFQRFHLLPYMTVADNIRVPLALQGRDDEDAITAMAERLQIAARLQHLPSELSIGEQQRVAVARALIGGKQLILADEPTGNLDEANAAIVAEVLKQESEGGRIVAMVTHNRALMGMGNWGLRLDQGRLAQ